MHGSSAGPIKINLGYSTWLSVFLLQAHLFALVPIFLIDLETYLRVFLVALIVSSLIYYWRNASLYLVPKSVIGIDWSIDRGWLLRLKDGSKLKGLLCPTSFISRYILILHFKTTDNGRRRVAIVRDAIDCDQFRRLRVLLKMHDHFGM